MSLPRLRLTARHKITLVFVLLVSVLLFSTSYMLFYIAESTWKAKTMELMQTAVDQMTKESNVSEQFINYRIFNADGTIKKQAGIFEKLGNDVVDGIIQQDRHYYIIYNQLDKGKMNIGIAEDVTDVVGTRYQQANIFLGASWVMLIIIIVTGIFFTNILFRPIRDLQKISETFDGYKLPNMGGLTEGNINDEIVGLARSMSSLFLRIQQNTETLENFSDNIAHEIKNRLFEIQSTLETGKLRNPVIALDESLSLIQNLSAITNSLLILRAGSTDLVLQPTLVADLLTGVFGDSKNRIQILGNSGVIWNVDPSLFATALFNIVQNGLKYSTGIVEINIGKHVIQITDHGIGIAKHDIPYIFDRLFKVDISRKYNTGHGLGLAITKKIIDAHGFTIDVESKIKKGTIISIKNKI